MTDDPVYIHDLRSRVSVARSAYSRRARLWFLLFVPAFVVQNTYFGWNRTPESRIEAYTDFLHVIPFVCFFGNLIACQIAARFEEVLSDH